jgi:hypothetical protein
MMTRPAVPQRQSSRAWLTNAADNAVLAGISIYAIGQAGLATWMFGDASFAACGWDEVCGLINPSGRSQSSSPAGESAQ